MMVTFYLMKRICVKFKVDEPVCSSPCDDNSKKINFLLIASSHLLVDDTLQLLNLERVFSIFNLQSNFQE